MSRFHRFITDKMEPALIEPGTIRAILPSKHGPGYTLLTLDGGVKLNVKAPGPDALLFSLGPEGEPNLLPAESGAASVGPTWAYVHTFAEAMEQRLAENRHKGDREGWLKETTLAHVERALAHLKELETALLHGRVERHDVERLTADCANRLMMAADVYANN